jgi:hypothetical protein
MLLFERFPKKMLAQGEVEGAAGPRRWVTTVAARCLASYTGFGTAKNKLGAAWY